jgi:hypothetical protein
MKKNYFISLLFAFVFLANNTGKAQNWTVGTPVDLQLSYLTKYSGFCTPQPDFRINVVCNQVDGIQYMVIVDSLVDIAVIPFVNDTIELGDTLLLSAGNNNYTFSFVNGPGNISLKVKAVGTPTTAGQNHPCSFSDNWMSNLLLCDEQLTLNLQNTCSVDNATAISNLNSNKLSFQAPNNSNQFQLLLHGLNSSATVNLFDITGKSILIKGNSYQSALAIPCQDLNNGFYFINITQQNKTYTYKFVLSK